MNKEQFKKQYNLTEEQFTGKQIVEGYLDLYSLTSIPEGFNPTVEANLNLSGLTSIPKGFNPTVGGDLYLSSLTSIPEGFNPTVGGDLDLSGLTSIPKGFNPTVEEGLYLNSLTSIPKGFNPTVGGDLYLSGLTSIPKGFNPTVEANLYLSGLTSIPKGFNPTVGGDLYLRSLTSIPEGFNPTVGGDLYLNSLTSIPKGFNPTVGGDVYLPNKLQSKLKYTKLNRNIPISFQNGKYIKIDGIFTEVVNHKGNVWRVKKLNNTKEFYLVTDGAGKYAHGDTLEQAREDLVYNISESADKNKYQKLTLNSTLSFEEGVEAYRVITGACSFGVKDFVTTKGVEKDKAYSVAEIIELTKGSYGSESFKQFFK